jgi:hypothetical protein
MFDIDCGKPDPKPGHARDRDLGTAPKFIV